MRVIRAGEGQQEMVQRREAVSKAAELLTNFSDRDSWLAATDLLEQEVVALKESGTARPEEEADALLLLAEAHAREGNASQAASCTSQALQLTTTGEREKKRKLVLRAPPPRSFNWQRPLLVTGGVAIGVGVLCWLYKKACTPNA